MARGRRHPEGCPICGVVNRSRTQVHRCSKRSLAAIDAANERAWEPCPLADLTNRSVSDKLREGFRILQLAEDQEECRA